MTHPDSEREACMTLLPCPFCGWHVTELLLDENDQSVVMCDNCMAGGSPNDTPEGAVTSWNSRTHADANDEPIACIDFTTLGVPTICWFKMPSRAAKHDVFLHPASGHADARDAGIAPDPTEWFRANDSKIASLAYRTMGEDMAEKLTFERSPEMFPQATYSVCRNAFERFVIAVIGKYREALSSTPSDKAE
jgi:hypothetical protein